MVDQSHACVDQFMVRGRAVLLDIDDALEPLDGVLVHEVTQARRVVVYDLIHTTSLSHDDRGTY